MSKLAWVTCLGLGLSCGVWGFGPSAPRAMRSDSLRLAISKGPRGRGWKPGGSMLTMQLMSKDGLTAPSIPELAAQIPAATVAKGMENPTLEQMLDKVKLEAWPWMVAGAIAAAVSVAAQSVTVAMQILGVELLFFGFCLLQAQWMNQPTTPEPVARDLTEMWKSCMDEPAQGAEQFLRGWFYDAPLEKISREDMRDFLSWATFSSTFQDLQQKSRDQVDHVIHMFEEKLDWKFMNREAGQEPTACMRFTLEPIEWVHKPLLWYAVVQGVLDFISRTGLENMGFRQHKCGAFKYWMRAPKTEAGKNSVPIVFVHGIGVGLITYLDFVGRLVHNDCPIICVELPFISSTVTTSVPSLNRQVASMKAILNRCDVSKAVFVGHSYGSVLLSWMVQHAPQRVAGVTFIDPVVIMLNLKDVLYNFLYRNADNGKISDVLGSELYLNFALRRNFWWYRNILWAGDIQDAGVPSLVILSENDEIVPSSEVEAHIRQHAEKVGRRDNLVQSYVLDGADHGAMLFDGEIAEEVVQQLNQFWSDVNARENVGRVRQPQLVEKPFSPDWVFAQGRWVMRKAKQAMGTA